MVVITVDELRALIRAELAAHHDNNDQPVYLTRKDTADLLSVTPKTVLKLISDGKLHAEKVGREWRIERAVVVAFMRRRKGD